MMEIACHSLTLCLRGKRPETADSAHCPLAPGKRHWTLPKAFFLLSGPELGPRPGTCAPPPVWATPNSKACAASQAIPVAVLCCCTLGTRCSNYPSDLWS